MKWRTVRLAGSKQCRKFCIHPLGPAEQINQEINRMRIVRRLTAVAGAVALAAAFAASAPAGAQTPEVYAGSALGRALNLSVLGQSATFGVSTAKIDSTLKAAADGAGQVLVLGSTTKAEVTGNNTKQEAPQACAAAVPAAPVLNLGLVCSASTA